MNIKSKSVLGAALLVTAISAHAAKSTVNPATASATGTVNVTDQCTIGVQHPTILSVPLGDSRLAPGNRAGTFVVTGSCDGAFWAESQTKDAAGVFGVVNGPNGQKFTASLNHGTGWTWDNTAKLVHTDNIVKANTPVDLHWGFSSSGDLGVAGLPSVAGKYEFPINVGYWVF
ncbi:hypothetical protein IO249_003430 [Salmonella enterica]|nr:hypothetical protein [Salmonella enterica]